MINISNNVVKMHSSHGKGSGTRKYLNEENHLSSRSTT